MVKHKTSSKPGWKKPRSGHSGGPPRITPPQASDRSLRVAILCSAAKSAVTAKLFWSAASDAEPTASPASSASSVRCRSEEHTSELQSRGHLVCRLLLEKKK